MSIKHIPQPQIPQPINRIQRNRPINLIRITNPHVQHTPGCSLPRRTIHRTQLISPDIRSPLFHLPSHQPATAPCRANTAGDINAFAVLRVVHIDDAIHDTDIEIVDLSAAGPIAAIHLLPAVLVPAFRRQLEFRSSQQVGRERDSCLLGDFWNTAWIFQL